MTDTFGAHNSVGSTIDLLEAELPRLEKQRQAQEKELAAVTGRLEAVRAALAGLRALADAPVLQEAVGVVEAAQEPQAASVLEETQLQPAAEIAPEPDRPVRRAASRKTAAGRRRTTGAAGPQPSGRAARKTSARKTAAKEAAAPAEQTGGLTEGVVDCLDRADGPLRARDVAQVLGRDDTLGGVNAVRSTLERLTKASRVQRTGRGLYQALPR